MSHLADTVAGPYVALLDAVPEAILLLGDEGTIVFANRQAAHLLGYTPDELAERDLEGLVPELPPGRVMRRIRSLGSAEGSTLGSSSDLRARRRDGVEIPVEMTMSRAEIGGGAVTVVTMRRRADAAHVQATERLAAIVESSADAIFTTDLNGVLTSWNRGAEQMYGLSETEVLGRPVSILIPAERMHEMGAVIGNISAGRAVDGLETVRLAKGGRALDVSITISPMRDTRGTIIGASTVARDITERRRADDRMRALLESAPDAVIVVGEGGRIVVVNRQTEEMFGYAREDLLGNRVEMLIPERLREIEAYGAGYFSSPETRQTGAALELCGQRADGAEFPVEMTFSPLDTDTGRLVYIAVRDISDRKAIDEELRRSNHDLEQFAYVASHDLSEPLRVIAGFVDLLARRYRGELDEEADKFIDFTVSGVERMQALIDDLLAYSRAGRVRIERRDVDVASVVRDVLWALEPQMKARAATVTIGEMPTVAAEETLLRQIFQNLVSNAIKFSDADAPAVEVRAVRWSAGWRFDVIDNGPGVEDRHAARVFEMFQRLHGREVAGSGMGLAIVKRLVERHGGRVWVSPAHPRGSVFSFTIPDLHRAP